MRTASTTLVLILLAGTPAFAQNRVDPVNPLTPKRPGADLGGGRILDASLSTSGGGRINTQVRDLDASIRQNNAIITGQASAGRAFRGSLGYKATDQFGGSISDNNSYSFRRDAASGIAPSVGIRTTDALNYQFSLTTGSRAGSAGSGDAAVLRQLAASSSIVRGGEISSGSTAAPPPASFNALRSISQYESQSSRLPTLLGYQGVPGDANVYAVTASPLRGIAVTPISDPGTGANSLVGIERLAGGIGDLSTVLGKKYINGRLVSQTLADNAIPATNVGAVQIDTRLTPSGTSYDQVITSLTQTIDQRFVVSPPRPVAPPVDPLKPIDPNNPNADPSEKPLLPDPAAPGWISQLDLLKSKLRRDAMLSPGGDTAPGGSSIIQEPPTTTTDPKDLAAADPLIAALRKSGVKLDELIAKAGPGTNAADAYTLRMQQGQAKLSEGKFFESESYFALALVMRPDDPMARLGRVNAQLGAGLFVSAAANLRDLFADNPELVSVKFGPELLPTPARADELSTLLETGFSDPLSLMGGDGGLLLAFLGRQYSEKDWVAKGLKNLQSRTGKDNPSAVSLTELLTRVWAE